MGRYDKKTSLLMILDGGGIDVVEDNAIANANTYRDKLIKENPNTLIGTAGADVGLPEVKWVIRSWLYLSGKLLSNYQQN